MKVEIGETLICAWVRHVRGCRIAQMNWKPSLTWREDDVHADILEQAKNYFSADVEFSAALSKKAKREQIIRQVECDVLAEDTEGNLIDDKQKSSSYTELYMRACLVNHLATD